ncbi:MAG: NAD(P)/FAD-dependent oxidoreductase [bacterium]|nr:NAD(P)/FAD-dependent oxidoreductase [bacterium]
MTRGIHKKIKILIVGTGFGGTYALRYLHKVFCIKDKRVEISIIGDKNYFLFTPLLHEVATGGVHISNVTEPIRKVLGCCVDNFHLGTAEEINTQDQYVKVGGKNVGYDYLVLAQGGETNFFNTEGAKEYSFPLKTLPDAIRMKNHCLTQMEKASQITDETERRGLLRFVVVGGGATGVELVGELIEFVRDTFAYYYAKKLMNDIEVVIIQKNKELLPQFGPKLRERSLKIMQKKGVKVLLNTGVTKLEKDKIVLDNGQEIYTENVFWVAGVKPSTLNFDIEIKKLPDGKMVVNEFLQVIGNNMTLPNVFAIGDAAAFEIRENIYAPALAQIAVHQAKTVATNIKLASLGKNPEKYKYNLTGNLVSLGKWNALGEIHRITFGGRFTWWLWRTVYLFKVISWRKRLIIAIDWTLNLFFPRDISQI